MAKATRADKLREKLAIDGAKAILRHETTIPAAQEVHAALALLLTVSGQR